jgi:hypothetical protein
MVVAWGVGRGHIEISGSATGLTSRPSAEKRLQSQVTSTGVSQTPRTFNSADVCSFGRLVIRVGAMTLAILARLIYQTLLARMSAEH